MAGFRVLCFSFRQIYWVARLFFLAAGFTVLAVEKLHVSGGQRGEIVVVVDLECVEKMRRNLKKKRKLIKWCGFLKIQSDFKTFVVSLDNFGSFQTEN